MLCLVLCFDYFLLRTLTEKPQYVYQSVSESVDDTKKQTNIGVISTRTTMGILSVFGVALTGWSFFNSAANRGFLRRKKSKKIRYSDFKNLRKIVLARLRYTFFVKSQY